MTNPNPKSNPIPKSNPKSNPNPKKSTREFRVIFGTLTLAVTLKNPRIQPNYDFGGSRF